LLEYGSFVSDGLFVGHDGRRSTGFAAVAQSVEQRIRNAKVTSSIPVSGTKISSKIKGLQAKAVALFFSSVQLSAVGATAV
jgi:hypothetical protein